MCEKKTAILSLYLSTLRRNLLRPHATGSHHRSHKLLVPKHVPPPSHAHRALCKGAPARKPAKHAVNFCCREAALAQVWRRVKQRIAQLSEVGLTRVVVVKGRKGRDELGPRRQRCERRRKPIEVCRKRGRLGRGRGEEM